MHVQNVKNAVLIWKHLRELFLLTKIDKILVILRDNKIMIHGLFEHNGTSVLIQKFDE